MQFRERKVLFPLAILLAAIVLSVIIGVSKPKPEAQPRPEDPAFEVAAMIAMPKTRAVVVNSQGTVQPKIEIELVAQVAGRVNSVAANFVDGGFFTADEALVQIDPRDYNIETIRAESRVADAEQALALERGKVRQAKREWRDLGNDEANALFLRKPQLAAAEAALKAAIAEHQKTQLNLQRTTISVPFAGRIRSTSVNLGQYVAAGMSVAKVFSSDVLEVRLPLTDRQVGLLPRLQGRTDSTMTSAEVIAVYGGVEYRWSGSLVRMDAAIDTSSRVRYAIVEIANPFDTKTDRPPLVVGQFARVEVQGLQYDDVIEVPLRALHEKNNLLILDEKNRLNVQPVQVLQMGGQTALVRGVAAGTVVLINRPSHVIEGMHIVPVLQEAEL